MKELLLLLLLFPILAMVHQPILGGLKKTKQNKTKNT